MHSHILVVDDDATLRNYIGTQLQRQNHRVSGAADGRGALALMHSDPPDLVILDHYLPDMSGEEVLGLLRADERTRPIPVIYLTIDGSRKRLRSIMNAGADDFLSKPVGPKDLVDAVATQLDKYRRRGLAKPAGTGVAGLPPGYRLLGTIASGGTATAYLARHEDRELPCVIKTMTLTSKPDPALIERFSREGALLERLLHPNIVRVYEHGIIGEQAYLVVEYLEGGTLKQMIGQPWTPTEALRLIRTVAGALGAAHAAGVVHRDIKPDNIVLRPDSLDPVLLDFGTAKDAHADLQATGKQSILGTPSYIAPEVIRGQGCVPASDVYACGVILYELLTGARPFVADSSAELLRRHLEYPIPLLPSRLAGWKPLLDRMLAKDPADRPRDGSALSAELTRFWLGLDATERLQ